MSTIVMVVEDDANIGALVRTYLQHDGYQTVWVRSGEDALAKLSRHPIEPVVLDIGLPGIDGFEVYRRIDGRVPVIMLTARDDEADGRAPCNPRCRADADGHETQASQEREIGRALLQCQGPPPLCASSMGGGDGRALRCEAAGRIA
jgi:CheY-like chemotaxis protein